MGTPEYKMQLGGLVLGGTQLEEGMDAGLFRGPSSQERGRAQGRRGLAHGSEESARQPAQPSRSSRLCSLSGVRPEVLPPPFFANQLPRGRM